MVDALFFESRGNGKADDDGTKQSKDRLAKLQWNYGRCMLE